MNINADFTIEAHTENYNDHFPEINVTSSKFCDTICLKQNGNVINLCDYQIFQLRKIFEQILD